MTHRIVVSVLAMALAVAACSVPRDDNARIITDAPRNTAVPITTSNVDAPRTQAKVFFVRSSDKKLEGIMTSVKLSASGEPGPSMAPRARCRPTRCGNCPRRPSIPRLTLCSRTYSGLSCSWQSDNCSNDTEPVPLKSSGRS